MQAEILNNILEPFNFICINSGDLAQLVKFRIGQNGKYWYAGFSLAAAIGTLGFVFTKVRHLTGIRQIQCKNINTVMIAL